MTSIALLLQPPGEHVSIVLVVVDNEQRALPRHWTAGLANSDVILSISGSKADRLGVEVVATGGERQVAVIGHGMGAQHDDRDVLCRRIGFELPRRLPSIDDREPQIHQDEIGLCGLRNRDRLLAIDGQHHVVPAPLQPATQRVAARLVVFHDQDCGHRGSGRVGRRDERRAGFSPSTTRVGAGAPRKKA